MPTYGYHCEACGTEFDVHQRMSDAPLTKCEECGVEGKLHRIVTGGAGVIFKGAGFYETDYKRRGKKGACDSGECPAPSGPSGCGCSGGSCGCGG